MEEVLTEGRDCTSKEGVFGQRDGALPRGRRDKRDKDT